MTSSVAAGSGRPTSSSTSSGGGERVLVEVGRAAGHLPARRPVPGLDQQHAAVGVMEQRSGGSDVAGGPAEVRGRG